MHADAASAAVADASVEELVAGLHTTLLDHAGFRDARDVMLDFAPFYDAATKLGADPASIFERAADGVPDDVADLARTFGRRSGVTLAAFGWRFTTEGDDRAPRYRFAWPW